MEKNLQWGHSELLLVKCVVRSKGVFDGDGDVMVMVQVIVRWW